MRLDGMRSSSNVEDRRGMSGGKIAGGGIGGLLLILLIGYLTGHTPNITDLQANNANYVPTQQENMLYNFSSKVLASTEDVWAEEFQRNGLQYQDPKMAIYTQQTQSGCGLADSGMGPFYCPMDKTIYLDLSFYNELSQRFKAPGDFAMAYVIAHEVGHHVQDEVGTIQKVNTARQQMNEEEANKLSVRLELQADYLAGVWAKHANDQNLLSPGDIEEAVQAAQAVGDDAIQKQVTGTVNPDTFTHGTSEQRIRWFNYGYQNGTLNGGDTFKVDERNL